MLSPKTSPSRGTSPGRNPQSLECERGQTVKAGPVSFLPTGTSSCSVQYLPVLLKPGICPDLRRPTGPLRATLRSHDSSPAAAPAQSRQKPSVAFPPSEQRGPRGARAACALGPLLRAPDPRAGTLSQTSFSAANCLLAPWHTALRRAGDGAPAWASPLPRVQTPGEVGCPTPLTSSP